MTLLLPLVGVGPWLVRRREGLEGNLVSPVTSPKGNFSPKALRPTREEGFTVGALTVFPETRSSRGWVTSIVRSDTHRSGIRCGPRGPWDSRPRPPSSSDDKGTQRCVGVLRVGSRDGTTRVPLLPWFESNPTVPSQPVGGRREVV